MPTSRVGRKNKLSRMEAVLGLIKKKLGGDDRGFTLIEMIVVIAIISMLFMIAAPRISRIVTNQQENFAIFTGIIATTFDDAFLKNRTDFLKIYLSSPDPEDQTSQKDDSHRKNGVAVQNFVNNEWVDCHRKSLKYKEFPDSFLIEEVITPAGEKISNGNVLIPFYPQGYANNYVIHILVKGEQKWSIRINKHIKEPKVLEGYVSLDVGQ
jgi:prepilin-type N-terminal cleavage/methylation domain-containing protein